MATFAYLDESGDTGFKRLGSGTSDYFVLTLVLIDDPGPVHTTMSGLRAELGLPSTVEFKFTRNSPHWRERFLTELRKHDLSIRALVVSKALFMGRPEARSKETFYRSLVRNILIRNADDLSDSTLILDEYVRGCQAQQDFNTAVRQALNRGESERRVKDIHPWTLPERRHDPGDRHDFWGNLREPCSPERRVLKNHPTAGPRDMGLGWSRAGDPGR